MKEEIINISSNLVPLKHLQLGYWEICVCCTWGMSLISMDVSVCVCGGWDAGGGGCGCFMCYYFFKVTFCLFQFGGAAKMYDGNCHLNAEQSYNPADKIYVSQLYLYCCLAIFQVCCNVIDEMFAVAFCFIY